MDEARRGLRRDAPVHHGRPLRLASATHGEGVLILVRREARPDVLLRRAIQASLRSGVGPGAPPVAAAPRGLPVAPRRSPAD